MFNNVDSGDCSCGPWMWNVWAVCMLHGLSFPHYTNALLQPHPRTIEHTLQRMQLCETPTIVESVVIQLTKYTIFSRYTKNRERTLWFCSVQKHSHKTTKNTPNLHKSNLSATQTPSYKIKNMWEGGGITAKACSSRFTRQICMEFTS